MSQNLPIFAGLGGFVPADFSRKITSIQQGLNAPDDICRLTKHDNLHITLKFAGVLNEDQQAAVITALDRHVKFEPFDLRIESVGHFVVQKGKYIYLWLGISDSPALRQLQYDVDNIFRDELGMSVVGTFRPHMTVARLTVNNNLDDLMRTYVTPFEKRNKRIISPPITINAFQLYESVKDKDGQTDYKSIMTYMAKQPLEQL